MSPSLVRPTGTSCHMGSGPRDGGRIPPQTDVGLALLVVGPVAEEADGRLAPVQHRKPGHGHPARGEEQVGDGGRVGGSGPPDLVARHGHTFTAPKRARPGAAMACCWPANRAMVAVGPTWIAASAKTVHLTASGEISQRMTPVPRRIRNHR